MQDTTFTLMNREGTPLFVYRWLPDKETPFRGIVQIAHGMCETALRYEEAAAYLTRHGYIVYANDHLGHGRTASGPDMLGNPGPDAFNRMAEDMAELGAWIRKEQPALPIILMGHSMGSFLTQKLMYDKPELYSGFILSGTNGKRSLLKMGERLAVMQSMMRGENHRSMLLNALVFGGFNRSFRPARTPFDWLSRDQEEVDLFINDPLCGAICTAGFFRDFFKLLQDIQVPSSLLRIPKDKPVYLFSGEQDPVGLHGKGVLSLADQYRELGIHEVTYKLYPEGRHEMLHEVNREEVFRDLVKWLDTHTPAVAEV
ncbi:alpha/beta fold hydrolase [Paenibacillus sp. JX-17]|uniref:Alpha/beta fold hydrolase n=1 Tax=Paenibacillus lacisoli TaxID=3064525 RepID=A0ABT9CDT9_9BACL|nr:alpha/beta fold hydrolase [Paenibacillus sp. JX-17]MDO7907444.1 alpha/beta fold hydrolase [Paenibacillus sp. JX-17]